MAKFLGYGELALSQDADGNVSKWYRVGDEIPDSQLKGALGRWLVSAGFTFDPMPGDAPAPVSLTPSHINLERGGDEPMKGLPAHFTDVAPTVEQSPEEAKAQAKEAPSPVYQAIVQSQPSPAQLEAQDEEAKGTSRREQSQDDEEK